MVRPRGLARIGRTPATLAPWTPRREGGRSPPREATGWGKTGTDAGTRVPWGAGISWKRGPGWAREARGCGDEQMVVLSLVLWVCGDLHHGSLWGEGGGGLAGAGGSSEIVPLTIQAGNWVVGWPRLSL